MFAASAAQTEQQLSGLAATSTVTGTNVEELADSIRTHEPGTCRSASAQPSS